jgi:hypothetical protein
MEGAEVARIACIFVLGHLLKAFRNQEQASALISRLLLGNFAIEQRKL